MSEQLELETGQYDHLRPEPQGGDTWVENAGGDLSGFWVGFAAKTPEGHHVNYLVHITTGQVDRLVHDGTFNLVRPVLGKDEEWVGKPMVAEGFVFHSSVDKLTKKRIRYTCRHDGKLLYRNEVPQPNLKGIARVKGNDDV